MKKAALFLLSAFLICGVYSECPFNFDPKKDLVERMDREIKKLSFILKDMQKKREEKVDDRNRFINNVLDKDISLEEITSILSIFLQQYIKECDADLHMKLSSIHKMFNLSFKMKNSVDSALLEDLKDEFLNFKKLMGIKSYRRFRESKPCRKIDRRSLQAQE